MIKKLLIIFIMIMLLGIDTFAQSNVLLLEDAKEKVDDTSSIKKIEYSIDSLKNNYDNLMDIVDLIPIGIVFSPDEQMIVNMGMPITRQGRLDLVKSVYIQPLQLLASIENLKNVKLVTASSIKLGVEELYYTAILLDESIRFQEETNQLSELQYKNAQDRFENGLISNDELQKARLKNEQDLIRLQMQRRELQNLKLTISKMIGNDLGYDFELEYDVVRPVKFELGNLNEYIALAKENRADMKKLEEDIEVYDKELFFTEVFFNKEETEYKMTERKLKTAQRQLFRLQEEIQIEIENAYETAQINYNGIEEAEIDYQNALEKYNDMKTKYDEGLITKEVLDTVHLGVSGSKINVLKAINEYNLSVSKFNAAVGIGPNFN